MCWKKPARLSYILIFGCQVPLFLVALHWYPDLVARLLENKALESTAGGTVFMNLALTGLVLSPALLMFGPYRIAHAFWGQLERWSGEAAARRPGEQSRA